MDFDPTVTSMFASDVTGPAAGEGSEIRPDYHPPARDTVNYFFLTCMRGWLVGCQFNIQGFPSGKVFVPQTVLWYKILVNFFFGGKNKQTKKTRKTNIHPRVLGIPTISFQ